MSLQGIRVERAKAKATCRCGGKTVYFQSYNGQSLCSNCFNNSIFEKTKRTISKYDMLHFGEKVGVAVSGGKDSTSLLFVLNQITKGHGTKLYALTIDEGIDGYREEAVKNAEKLAESLSIPILICSYKELFGLTLDEALHERDEKMQRMTSCAVCGPFRRRSIDKAAEKLGVNLVATAHNLDDVLQTFYINLYSGDLERIKWLDPNYKSKVAGEEFNLRRIKPMIEVYEQELAFFAYLNDLPFQSESCPYMNEGIRTEIRLHLNELERKHPGVKYSTLKSILGIAASMNSGSPNSKPVLRCQNCGAVSSGAICSVCQTLKLLT